jgi:hypothetical protein
VKGWIYPLLCLLVPQLWAVLVARGFARRELRKQRALREKAASAPTDFSI